MTLEKPVAEMTREQAVELYERERKFETFADDPDAAAVRAIQAAYAQGIAANSLDARREPVAVKVKADRCEVSMKDGSRYTIWNVDASPPRPLVPLTEARIGEVFRKHAGANDNGVPYLRCYEGPRFTAIVRDLEKEFGIGGTQGSKT